MDILKYIKALRGPSTTSEGWHAYIGVILLYALIGLFIPDTILIDYQWARGYANFIASFIPQIDRITALNIAPDFNRFYYSVLWPASLPSVYLLFHSMRQDVALGLYPKNNKISPEGLAGLLLWCSLMVGFSMFLWIGFGFVRNDNIVVLRLFAPYFNRAVTGPIIVLGFWATVVLTLVIIEGIVEGRIKITSWKKITW